MKTAVNKPGMSLRNNRKVRIFLFFLVLTSIIWLLIELSKTYTSSAVFKIEYKNLPADKLLQSKPIQEVNVAIKAPGFNLVKYKAVKHKITLNLKNVIKNNTSYYLLPNAQISNLNAQLPSETEIVKILSDTIFIELGNNISKKIPVNPSIDIKYKLGYNLTEDLKIIPDSIIISGPEKYIDSVKEITTTTLKLNEVYENINIDLPLKTPLKKNIVLSDKSVKIKGEVDKFTEGSFTIPVTIINEPEGVKVRPFPNEIEIVYQAGLSNFNKINKNSVQVAFDYKEYQNDTLIRFLTPVIMQKSEFISSIRINPNQIEFLIQK
ncbi:hypothetical protein [Lutibacter sp. B1]|uniref:hypothetical protein n=1 Tax=Lutibacter sp. B1 TaxID=2725996 RepID=UPI001456AD78|nr:hypothetical protein [Lutibacter sp. B1]NLP56989.1 hypothetical protein [Lutibacter sp. B1]